MRKGVCCLEGESDGKEGSGNGSESKRLSSGTGTGLLRRFSTGQWFAGFVTTLAATTAAAGKGKTAR